MRVTVVGMGYAGLATAAALAWAGHEVHGVEIDRRRLDSLRRRRAPFHEPGLDGVLAALGQRLTFGGSLEEAIPGADAVLLAVGTPSRTDGSADLSQLWGVADYLRGALAPGSATLVVNKSTAPVGTLEALRSRLPEGTPVAANPEFLRQGRALLDSLYPDRVVAGSDDAGALLLLEAIYRPVLDRTFPHPEGLPGRPPVRRPAWVAMDARSAELAKYAANAFLATKISFANEVANLCDAVGADVERVTAVLGSDPRIGAEFLRPGVGYGGSCFPKDTRALRQMAGQSGYDFRLLSAVIEVNRLQPLRVLDRLRRALGGLDGRRVAVLGTSFKPGTDDMREAPSLVVVPALVEGGAEVRVHDPVALEAARRLLPPCVRFEANVARAVTGADALVLLTEWPAYRALDAADLTGMRGRLVVDGRNALDPDRLPGFAYLGVGRRAAAPETPPEPIGLAAEAGRPL